MFNSAKIAAKTIGVKCVGSIRSACSSIKLKSSYGFMWCYEGDLENKVGKKYKKIPCPRMKAVKQHSLNGELLKEWPSITAAAKSLDIKIHFIQGCCSGRYKSGWICLEIC